MTFTFSKKFVQATLIGLGSALLAACSSNTVEHTYPDRDADKLAKYGSVLGDDKLGFSTSTPLGDEDEEDAEQAKMGIGVNSYLWRATLDTLSFMPITTADAFGGVILTDWYRPDASKAERFKVNVTILDRRLKASNLRVSAFKQIQTAKGDWVDQPTSKDTARKLEDAILNKARQLRASAQQATQ